MGCSSVSEIDDLQQETIELDMESDIKELNHAKSLINLITRIRNKMIHLYHKLIYDSGACVFLKPTIVHCLKSILYKISSEFEGNLINSELTFMNDPPYLKLSNEVKLSEESVNLLEELFQFVIELISYKTIIKQIEKEIPELIYLVHEKKNKLSKKNIELINKGIDLFKNLKQLKSNTLILYRNLIFEFENRKECFCEKIDIIGKYAYEKNITNIYEISMLQKNAELNIKSIDKYNKDDEDKMFKSVYNAKIYMENILNNEKNDDIIESHESIIENLNNSNINRNNN
jgi:hypothetical protein